MGITIKVKLSELIVIATTFLALFIMEGYWFINANPILGVAIIIIFFCGLARKSFKVRLGNTEILWVLFSFILIVGAFYSVNLLQGIKFGINILVLVIVMILLSGYDGWQNAFCKNLWICSLVHVIATLCAFVFPNLVSSISKVLLSASEYEINQYLLYTWGGNPGITGQTGLNAWFISVFIAISFVWILSNNKNKKKFYTLMFVAGVFALLLANKRGLLLGNIIAIFVVTWVFGVFEKKALRMLASVILLIILMICIIVAFIPDTVLVFSRLITIDNFDTGRSILYSEMGNYFLSSPFIGVGTYSMVDLIGEAGHNVYLQVMAENGIFAFILYISIMLGTMYRTLRCIKYVTKNEIDKYYEQLLVCLYIQVLFIVYAMSGNPLYNIQFIATYLFIVPFNELVGLNKNALLKEVCIK